MPESHGIEPQLVREHMDSVLSRLESLNALEIQRLEVQIARLRQPSQQRELDVPDSRDFRVRRTVRAA